MHSPVSSDTSWSHLVTVLKYPTLDNTAWGNQLHCPSAQCDCDLYSVSLSHMTQWHCSVTQSCPTFCHPMNYSPPDSSLHKILQARILEWVASSFCRRSSWPLEGLNSGPLHWKVDSLPLSHLGSPFDSQVHQIPCGCWCPSQAHHCLPPSCCGGYSSVGPIRHVKFAHTAASSRRGHTDMLHRPAWAWVKRFTRLSFIPSLPLLILSKKHYLHLLDIRYKGVWGSQLLKVVLALLYLPWPFLKLKNNLNNPHS